MFKWTKPKIARLKDLYRQGHSHKIIRIILGCQHTELSEKIKELGLERPDKLNKVREGRINESISGV